MFSVDEFSKVLAIGRWTLMELFKRKIRWGFYLDYGWSLWHFYCLSQLWFLSCPLLLEGEGSEWFCSLVQCLIVLALSIAIFQKRNHRILRLRLQSRIVRRNFRLELWLQFGPLLCSIFLVLDISLLSPCDRLFWIFCLHLLTIEGPVQLLWWRETTVILINGSFKIIRSQVFVNFWLFSDSIHFLNLLFVIFIKAI